MMVGGEGGSDRGNIPREMERRVMDKETYKHTPSSSWHIFANLVAELQGERWGNKT